MGNCPSGFQTNSAAPLTCVVECPTIDGFDLRVIGQQAVCAYRDDPKVNVPLKAVPGIYVQPGKPTPTLDQLKSQDPRAYQGYMDSQADFEKRYPIVKAALTRDKQLGDSFKELQQAENARDKSPQAYQDARSRYYTLLRGDAWLDEERNRINESEVMPKIVGYLQTYTDMSTRLDQQRKTFDIVQGVKDRILSLKDDFAYTTNTFTKQIGDLKNQIEIEKKKSEEEKKSVVSWFGVGLNLLIILLTVVAVVVVVRKLLKKPAPQQSAYMLSPSYR
jgi:hypothetical protein